MDNIDYIDDAIEEIDSETEDATSHIPIYTISSYPTDPSLELLHQRWERGEIEIPRFQRGWVWKHAQASQLVESFLLGLPVPSIFMYRDQQSQHSLVIDGQQRLRTIWGFLEGKLPDGQDFYLRDVNERWNGKSYADLSEVDRIRFRDAVLRTIVIEQADPHDNSSIYHIFERLNTGGTQLNPQEIRNSAANGPFNDLMIELNGLNEWRHIFGKERADERMRDVELVTRFCALKDNSEDYSTPMKAFLNDYMKRHQSKTDYEPATNAFEATTKRVLENLGPKPFHIRRGINVAVYDSTMLAFSRTDRIPNDINSRWENLIKNPEYQKVTTSGTTSERAVKTRIDLAWKILFE